ncbi:MAG TPA: hypothetical protein VGD56_13420 [Gemmatirosa sp.]
MPIVIVPLLGPPARPQCSEAGADLAGAAQAIGPVPGGVRLTFAPAPGVHRAVERAVARARRDGTCLRFVIHAPPGGPITLTITGPPGLAG